MNKNISIFFPEVTFNLKPASFVWKHTSHKYVSHNMLSPKGMVRWKMCFVYFVWFKTRNFTIYSYPCMKQWEYSETEYSEKQSIGSMRHKPSTDFSTGRRGQLLFHVEVIPQNLLVRFVYKKLLIWVSCKFKMKFIVSSKYISIWQQMEVVSDNAHFCWLFHGWGFTFPICDIIKTIWKYSVGIPTIWNNSRGRKWVVFSFSEAKVNQCCSLSLPSFMAAIGVARYFLFPDYWLGWWSGLTL